MDIGILMNQIVELFLMMLVGFLMYKWHIMSPTFNKHLTTFLVDGTMPLLIISSVMEQTGPKDYVSVGIVFLVSTCLMLLLPVVGFGVGKVLRLPKNKRGIYSFMMTFSNIGFMGFPIIDALYGSKAVLYTAIYNIVFNLCIFSIGILLLRNDSQEEGDQASAWKALKGKLLSAGFMGAVLAIILYFLPITTYPSVLYHVVDKVGGLTSPIAMLLIGANLASMNFREVFDDFRVYLFALIKQVAVPLLLWLVINPCLKDPVMKGTMFVLILMPVANNALLFATKYGADEKLATKNIFITTLISLATIPLCLWIVGLV
ncbi:MAG: AEC family transporter [Eubacterium sp.]|nr:AEC family transporter [Eubacterium sp.]